MSPPKIVVKLVVIFLLMKERHLELKSSKMSSFEVCDSRFLSARAVLEYHNWSRSDRGLWGGRTESNKQRYLIDIIYNNIFQVKQSESELQESASSVRRPMQSIDRVYWTCVTKSHYDEFTHTASFRYISHVYWWFRVALRWFHPLNYYY